MAEQIQKTDTLNQGRVKLNSAITDADRAKVDAGVAKSTANQALSKSESTQKQLDQIVIEGDSSVEAAQARVDAKGTPHTTLKARLDAEQTEITSQFAQKEQELFYQSTINHKSKKALMVMIDDDLRPQVYTLLKPVIELEKVPFTCAVITGRVGTSDSLTLAQMRELESIGFNFTSHTVTHPHLADLATEQEIENELKNSSEWLRSNGFKTYNTAIVYPYGSEDERVRRIARKYYKAGILAGTEKLNTPPLKTYQIDRVYYNTSEGVNQIAHVKQKIDEAITNGNLLVVGMHCFYSGFNPNGLTEVIQYAKSKGIEIVTLDEALTRYGNILDIDSPYGGIQVGNDGSGNIKDYIRANGLAYEVTVNSPISAYPMGKSLTYFTLSNPNVAGFPAAAGSLETIRPADSYSFQRFKPYRSDDTYERWWDNTSLIWREWVKQSTIDFSHNAPQSVTSGNDWGGSLNYSKSVDNVVHLRGTMTAGTVARNHEVLTIPALYSNAWQVIDAFNHTKQRKVDFYLTNTGALRLTDVTNIATGDSIRFNSLYRINS